LVAPVGTVYEEPVVSITAIGENGAAVVVVVEVVVVVGAAVVVVVVVVGAVAIDNSAVAVELLYDEPSFSIQRTTIYSPAVTDAVPVSVFPEMVTLDIAVPPEMEELSDQPCWPGGPPCRNSLASP
jgi:hypothetical protein